MKLKEKLLGNVATRLQEQSLDVLNVFTKTVKSLEELNTQADKEHSEREALIKKAQEEQAILQATKAKNNAVISKINEFLKND